MTPFPFIAPKTHQEDPRPREDLTETYLDTHTHTHIHITHPSIHTRTNTYMHKHPYLETSALQSFWLLGSHNV